MPLLKGGNNPFRKSLPRPSNANATSEEPGKCSKKKKADMNTHKKSPDPHAVTPAKAMQEFRPREVEAFPHIPQQLEALFREIKELPENWNSYGAARISQWSITQARKIVNDGLALGLAVPRVSPASGASVGIEWQTDNADLVIDVDPRQGITYLTVDKTSGAEIEGELNVDNRFEILRKVTDKGERTTQRPPDAGRTG